MDINTGSLLNISSPYTAIRSANVTINNNEAKSESKPETIPEELKRQGTKDKEMSKEDIEKTSADLNKIMQLLNANLQFSLHEKTQRIMVQLVDVKEQKVLKEFPPHELLDTIAAIRDYIGLLLDKKV